MKTEPEQTKETAPDVDSTDFVGARLLKPSVWTDGGPWTKHNMPCAVYPDKHAVVDCETGVFNPSRKAEAEGWMLIKPPKWLGRLLTRYKSPWPQRRGK